MSVIVAIISNRDGAVASDGRVFAPMRIENGRVAEPATVESDTFDKTFALSGGKVVGAFSGLMVFSGRTVAEHVFEIATHYISEVSELGILAQALETEMKSRLTQIGSQEVIFPCRKLDILLVGGANLTRSNMRIVSLRFSPKDRAVVSETETVATDRRNTYYVVRGEDKAAAGATSVFSANRVPGRDPAFLKWLTTEAVQMGINASGTHPHGTEHSCGGMVFTERTWYK